MSPYPRTIARAVAVACAFPSATILPAQGAFTDISASVGISHIHSARSDNANQHGGAAAFDADGDGYTDLVFGRYQKSPILYMNRGDGTFADETQARGLTGAVDAASFGAGDFDNDGDLDLFVGLHQGDRFLLFMNDGTGRFAEEAVARGADLGVSAMPHSSYSIGLVDFDLDGFLDISISEWGISSSADNERYSALLRNQGAERPGHFELATASAGLVQPIGGASQYGFASGWADFDEDGWPDLALVADFKQSQMYWNDGDGVFTRATRDSGVGLDENGMGIAVADYDGDGRLDFFVTSRFDAIFYKRNGTHTGNKLYRNLGNRRFEEVAAAAGVSRSGWGWGTAFFDYDNDADFDLIATNGSNLSEGGNPETTPYAAAATDPTTLWANNGSGAFSNVTTASGIADTAHGKAIVVLDFDRDGDEDVVVVNSFSPPIFYRNEAAGQGNDWIRFTFEGRVSNRDGIGALVRVAQGGATQTLYYNPTNAYIGQREAVLHFGLGKSGGAVDEVRVRWPSGIEQVLTNVPANQQLHLQEPDDVPAPPIFARQPVAEPSYEVGDSLTLEVAARGTPAPVYVWEKDGARLEGVSGPRLHIKRLAPIDAGVYQAVAINSGGTVKSVSAAVQVRLDVEAHSVARHWNEFLLEAIRKDFPDPTKHSRNLYHLSAAVWDAFWAYEEEGWSRARPLFHQEKVAPADWGADRLAAQREAISHAAYRVLMGRYAKSPGAERSQFGFRWLMEELGFDPDDEGTGGNGPAAVGNRIGKAVLEANYEDGSNEQGDYADTSGYVAINEPMPVELPGTTMADIDRWQPLAIESAVSQNGIPIGTLVQNFLGVNWRELSPFAMRKPSPQTIPFDPGPPPRHKGGTAQEFKDAVVEVIRFSSYLDPADGALMDISPGAQLNNPLGSNEGTGYSRNPYTGQPYEANVVKRSDYARILAEYWADGPASETPPGHWNALHNEIVDHPLFERRYMGVGEALSPLEWDVRAYLALNGGMHDAAIAAWTLKRQYDSSRPISIIRCLAGLGQSSDPGLPSYHPEGLPLAPDLIELITEASSAPGQRHEHLAAHVGELAVRSWRGEPADPHGQVGGVGWIRAKNWLPYQRSSFVSPAFAGYVSGHSAFSRSGAEVLTLLTGSPFFPGGLGSFRFEQGSYLEFEDGPSEDVRLEWATYYDAADQAGLSRLYGGIHLRADDSAGRVLGARVGVEAFLRTHHQLTASAGSGVFRSLRLERSPGKGEEATLVRFDSDCALVVRQVPLLPFEDPSTEEGVYFQFPAGRLKGSAASSVTIAAVGPLRGARFEADLEAGLTLSVTVEIRSREPALVLARAEGPSLERGNPGVKMRLFRRAGPTGGETEIDLEDPTIAASASRTAVLLSREGGLGDPGETDAAFSLPLSQGLYRVSLEGISGSGRAALELSGVEWEL